MNTDDTTSATIATACCSELSDLLEGGLQRGVFPAAQSAVIHDGRLVHGSCHGADHLDRATTQNTLFDVASVTKAAATTMASAVLVARDEIALDDRVASFIPELSGGGRDTITIQEVLAHGSGLPPWEPYFALAYDHPSARSIFPGLCEGPRDFDSSRGVVLDAVVATSLTSTRGRRAYSDLGFILLGRVLEVATSSPLDRLCRDLVYDPFELDQTGFFDLRSAQGVAADKERRHIIPTGRTRPREPAPGQEALYRVHEQTEKPDPGEVDDDNAYALGGVAGHAGLFSTAEELARLGWLVVEEMNGAERLGPGVGEVLAAFAQDDRTTAGDPRGLGFDRPAPTDSLVGRRFGRLGPKGAIGHFGFTGCSLWIDLDRRLVAVLLSNRTFHETLGRANVNGMRDLRPRFHDAVVDVIAG